MNEFRSVEGRTMTGKLPKHYIDCRQHELSWQPFLISGGYPRVGSGVPAGTGRCITRVPKIKCLFRRSKSIRKSGSKAAQVVDQS